MIKYHNQNEVSIRSRISGLRKIFTDFDNVVALDKAKNYNNSDPFKYVCTEILKNKIKQKYDYVLIDEAQDLPDEFFIIRHNIKFCRAFIHLD